MAGRVCAWSSNNTLFIWNHLRLVDCCLAGIHLYLISGDDRDSCLQENLQEDSARIDCDLPCKIQVELDSVISILD